ncbi:alpha/beta fold hydrolase [Bradyrhizobium sp. AUGA SZCCT0051]|uniref:alpha/beta fold hydrolase n=2 Tax=unclassified Bradyrhizobium TaxID=2631580 RepID=UPI003908AD94
MGLMTGLDGTHEAAAVVALHCSLGSGRQWTKLAGALSGTPFMAPDISGYGVAACGRDWPRTLDGEIARLEPWLAKATGPIHLVGHSYGGAIAFRLATASRYAQRIRSLTLIEPVLPRCSATAPPTCGCTIASRGSRRWCRRIFSTARRWRRSRRSPRSGPAPARASSSRRAGGCG